MTEPTRSHASLRWWILAAIFVLGFGSNVAIQNMAMRDQMAQQQASLIAIFSTALALLIWVLVFSRISWFFRFACLALGAGVFAGFNIYFAPQPPPKQVAANPTGPAPRDFSLSAPGAPQQDRSARDYKLPALMLTTAPSQPVDLATTTPQDYPRFLGTGARQTVDNVQLADDWAAHPPREIWRQPIGAGLSAFSIVGQYAVTQEQRGDFELVSCYELANGHVRWVHQDQTRFSESQGGDGPRATPTIFDGKVYSMGATGILNCLDGVTGKVIWSHNVLAEHKHPNLQWGKACSPLVFDNLVVVGLGEAPTPTLAAYDKDTGNQVWQAGNDAATYSSPVLANLAGHRQILNVNANSVTAHDPADGRTLWEYRWQNTNIKTSEPMPLPGDRVFLSCGYGVGAVMLQIKSDHDQLSAAELWRSPHMATKFTNIVFRDNYIYGLNEGVLTCISAETGKPAWRGDRYGNGQILLVGDKLLVMSDAGQLALLAADPAAANELGHLSVLNGQTWNNLALSGQDLLIRNTEEAACYELPLKQGKGQATTTTASR